MGANARRGKSGGGATLVTDVGAEQAVVLEYKRTTSNLKSRTRSAVSAAFTVRLEESTLDALDQLAQKTERSRNWLVAKAVEDYVSLNAWQVAKIEAGIAAADRGDFASVAELARVREKFSVRG